MLLINRIGFNAFQLQGSIRFSLNFVGLPHCEWHLMGTQILPWCFSLFVTVVGHWDF